MGTKKYEELKAITNTCYQIALEVWRKKNGTPSTIAEWKEEKDYITKTSSTLLEYCLRTGVTPEDLAKE